MRTTAITFIVLTITMALVFGIPRSTADTSMMDMPMVFPLCGPPLVNAPRIQIFPTFMTANEPSGSFGVAGCVNPYGSKVQVYFTDSLGKALPNLPTALFPITLTSRTNDGHFHQIFRLSPEDNNTEVTLHAVLPGCCQTSYPFAWVRPYCPTLCQNLAAGVVPFDYDSWTNSLAPPGAFTVFMETKVPNAHVELYFKNINTGGSVTGLPSQQSPWTGQMFSNGRGMISFIITTRDGLVPSVYNIDTILHVDELGNNTIFPLWVHPYIRPAIAGSLSVQMHTGYASLSWPAATEGGGGIQGYNIYSNGGLIASLGPTATSFPVTGIQCSTSYSFRVEARDPVGNTSPPLDSTGNMSSICVQSSGVGGGGGGRISNV